MLPCLWNAGLLKKTILKENKNKAGVYRWVNKLNGKSYYGSSANLGVRFQHYFNQTKLCKTNILINKALLKYGHYNFKLDIIEYCDPNVVLSREQYY
jgi:group I intron endonuclease